MAVYIKASGLSAARLIAKIQNEIKGNLVRTWRFNPTTGFVHYTKNGEWNTGAYLEVNYTKDPQQVVLYFKIEEGKTAKIGTFGVLNGRFAEMIMNHFRGNYEYVLLKDLR